MVTSRKTEIPLANGYTYFTAIEIFESNQLLNLFEIVDTTHIHTQNLNVQVCE